MSIKMPTHLTSGKCLILVPASRTGNNKIWAYRFKVCDFEEETTIDANLYMPCGSSKGESAGHIVFVGPTITFRP